MLPHGFGAARPHKVQGSVAKDWKAHKGMEQQGAEGLEGRRGKTLTRCQTGLPGLCTQGRCIAEPALWCLLTRLGENLGVFTNIINQERVGPPLTPPTTPNTTINTPLRSPHPWEPQPHLTCCKSVPVISQSKMFQFVSLLAYWGSLNRPEVTCGAQGGNRRLCTEEAGTDAKISASWFFSSQRHRLLGISQQVTHSDFSRRWREKKGPRRSVGCAIHFFQLCSWPQHPFIYWNPTA